MPLEYFLKRPAAGLLSWRKTGHSSKKRAGIRLRVKNVKQIPPSETQICRSIDLACLFNSSVYDIWEELEEAD
jgi:hypothetical protein